MGIERFFNSLRNDYNIVQDIKYEKSYILNSDNLFLDFNSIIHVVSQKLLGKINNLMLDIILYNNGCGGNSYDDNIKLLGVLVNDFEKPNDNQEKVLEYFKNYFDKNKLDNLIIHFVSLFVTDLLSKRFKKDKLKLIYIAVDGVPSKAKIVEQKKRRFMGEFDKNFKKIILENNKNTLDIDKNTNCKVPFNKYKFLTNLVSWSRSNISPATSFMIKLDKFLNSNDFKIKIKSIITSIDTSKIIISGFNEKDEGEKKIIDYINNVDNRINTSICIYSPDADVILLSMLIKHKTIIHILRHDQQKSEIYSDPIKAVYNIIKINGLKKLMFDFINIFKLNSKQTLNLNFDNTINDIVFIFTIFGDDFLHKIESFDVRNDIDIILDIYKQNHKNIRLNGNKNSYILDMKKEGIEINYNNFVSFLKEMSNIEDEMIKRNYFIKKYQNYRRLVKDINLILKKTKLENFKEINHNNLEEFIEIYNYNSNINRLNKLLLKGEINNIKYQILNNQGKYLNFLKSYRLYSIKEESINFNSNDIDILDQILNFFKKNKEMPKIKKNYNFNFEIPKVDYIYLKEFDNSILSSYHKRNTNNFDSYEKEIYKFENMLDEYQIKLNKLTNENLGDPSEDIEISRNKFYKSYFGEDKNKAVQNYIDGLQWILDYYYNNITYHKWYYLYNKSPLIKEIYHYISKKPNIFKDSKSILMSSFYVTKTHDMLTPLEQLLYITPFDRNKSYVSMFTSYSSKSLNNIKELLQDILNSSEFKDLYPDIKSITKNIYMQDKNSDIDCRGAYYLNKCILKVVNDSNMIDETFFKNLIRKKISIDEQNNEVTTLTGGNGINLYKDKYDKYKKLFLMTGKLEYKNKYKSIKKVLKLL